MKNQQPVSLPIDFESSDAENNNGPSSNSVKDVDMVSSPQNSGMLPLDKLQSHQTK